MKLVTLLVVLAAVPGGQAGTMSVAGSWTAQFEGTTFVRLEFTTADGAITGGISLGSFEVDSQGAVRRADESPRALKPIVDVERRASILRFSCKDGDSIERFEVRLLDAGGAELAILFDDEDLEAIKESGIPIPKPIRLTKQ